MKRREFGLGSGDSISTWLKLEKESFSPNCVAVVEACFR